MSTDFSIRPAGAPVPSPVVQPPSPAVSNAVATDLPASQTVTATDTGGAVRNDGPATNVDISHQAFYDNSASTMVYQVVNGATGQVVDQYPDQAVVRRRAYFQALDLSKATQPGVHPTD
ncbi:hypothetical protein, partial [Bradyrhizobium sp.]|uniref:hypothetical protein n=1 Tax=Bradyrhizobium sp. TaxID=376 RepID=UPI003C4F014D